MTNIFFEHTWKYALKFCLENESSLTYDLYSIMIFLKRKFCKVRKQFNKIFIANNIYQNFIKWNLSKLF